MSALPEQPWTVEAYLAFEQSDPQRHEYLGGKIYAMAGADQWLLSDVSGADASILLTTVECTLLVADLYEKVVFEAE
jgi:hypothetical protein